MRWQLPWQREVKMLLAQFLFSLFVFSPYYCTPVCHLFGRFLCVCLEGGVGGRFLVVHRSLCECGGLATQHGERGTCRLSASSE